MVREPCHDGGVNILRAVVASLMGPGFGAAVMGQRRVALGWLTALVVAIIGSAFSIWLLPLVLAIGIGGMIDNARRVWRSAGSGSSSAAIFHLALLVAVGIATRAVVVHAYSTPTESMVPTMQIGDHLWTDLVSPRVRAVAAGEVIAFDNPCHPGVTYVKRVVAIAGQRVEIRCDALFVDGKPVVAQLSDAHSTFDAFDEYEREPSWKTVTGSDYVETMGAHTYHVVHDAERGASTGGKNDFPLIGASEPPSCRSDEMGTPSESTDPWSAGDCGPRGGYVVPAGQVFVLGDNRDHSKDSRHFGGVPAANILGVVRGIYASFGRSGFSLSRFGGVP
jgi:signal peptidase I